MNVPAILQELRKEQKLIEETIAVLERLLYERNARRGRPPGKVNSGKPREQSGIKTKLPAEGEQTGQNGQE
jgi:hypothetical protein